MKKESFKIMQTVNDRVRILFLRVIWSIRYHGIDLTLLGIIIRVLNKLGIEFGLKDWYKKASSLRFDKRFGINTAGRINPDQLDISDQQKRSAFQYQPTASVTFGIVLSELNINYPNYVFIDYGSGKGRALIQAAHFPFKQIIGVEVSNALHQVAMDNLSNLRTRTVKCQNIVAVCEDAITFNLPHEPLVIYFYHPFNEEIMEEVLKNIFHSLTDTFKHIIVVYQQPIGQHAFGPNPELTTTLNKAKFLRKITIGITKQGWDIYETVSANEFSSLLNSLDNSAR